MLCFPGNQRSNPQSLSHPSRLNIAFYHLWQVNLFGSNVFYCILKFWLNPLSFLWQSVSHPFRPSSLWAIQTHWYRLPFYLWACPANIIKFIHVKAQHQLADIFTKAFPMTTFSGFIHKCGILNIYSPGWEGVLANSFIISELVGQLSL